MREFRATYRLQLAGELGFAKARSLVPYLAELGVSHLYLAPSFQARPGSTHGYDVVDPQKISDALGGEAEFRALVETAHAAGLGIVLDIVPNHMATDDANRWWADEKLRQKFFDIDPVTGRHRRFFDIDHLAGVRQEDPEVFEATHRLALELVRDGLVDGLRVDHPDGLADPAGYLQRLRDGGARHVWVEKILDPGERLRDWPVDGTVGYEFLNDVAGLFVDPAGEEVLTRFWNRLAGDERPFSEWASEAKYEQASGPFRPEVERLLRETTGVVQHMAESVSALPVYRTYIRSEIAPEDAEAIAGLPEEVRSRLVPDSPFTTRFQQTTPAIMAKGVEDTVFYRYGRLLALNDVGGDPGRFCVSIDDFHAGNAERAKRFPLNLLTTMTHDAKRSHDVRARIGALSTMAPDWVELVLQWYEVNEPIRGGLAGPPDRIEEYFIYQTLAGVWPLEVDRVENYMEKALREAKRNSNWIDPEPAWEAGVLAFVGALYDHEPFLRTFQPFVHRLAAAGERALMGQIALKLTAPGVPDIYNGDELPYRALVDPDNRRPVDWDERRRQLDDPTDAKFRLIKELLALRQRRPEAFAGDYEPLDAGDGTVAYFRGGEVLVAVAVRDDVSIDLGDDNEWEPVLADWPGIAVLERVAR